MSANDLIVVEAPKKVKKVYQYTDRTKTMPSIGHYMELPRKKLSIDIQNGYKPDFQVAKDKISTRKDIIEAAKGKDVYIATDMDREGEAIGFFIYEDIKKVAKNIYRMVFDEVSEKVIKEAKKNAIKYDVELVKPLFDGFLARRIGDRLVGYVLSPITHNAIGIDKDDYFSVGRVQTISVKAIVDREREIKNFVPEEFFKLEAALLKNDTVIKTEHSKGKFKPGESKPIFDKISNAEFAIVKDIIEKTGKSNPPEPYKTSTLQSEISNKLKISIAEAEKLLQDLYEAGYINYPRTDKASLGDECMEKVGDWLKQHHPEQYNGKVVYKNKGKGGKKVEGAQEAHEGVRPSLDKLSGSIEDMMAEVKANVNNPLAAKAYEMIARRTIASQMIPATTHSTTIIFDIEGEEFEGKSTIQKEEFKGFKKVGMTTSSNKELPELEIGEKLPVEKITNNQKFTNPPKRYKESDLVEFLEDKGIGRPSTFASFPKMCLEKNYAKHNQEKRMEPTQKAFSLIKYLEENHPWIVDYGFTKNMEDYIDKIINKEGTWQQFIKAVHKRMNFYDPTQDSGENRKPSPKQLNFAKKIEEESGVKLTEADIESVATLTKYIEANMTTEPSKKQVELMTRLASDLGENVPQKALGHRDEAKKYIEAAMKKSKKLNINSTPPSEKMMNYAIKISEKLGVPIPDEAMNRTDFLSKFIEQNKDEYAVASIFLSDKQRNVIHQNAPQEILNALDNEDLVTAKKWLDDFFKTNKK